MFEGDNEEFMKIDIGDISDIAKLLNKDELLNLPLEIRSTGSKEVLKSFTLGELLD